VQGRTGRTALLRNTLIAALMALLVGPATAFAAPTPGLSLGWVWQQPEESWPTHLAAVKAMGAETVRSDFTWESVQRERGANFDFTAMDRRVAALATAGLRPWMLLSYSAQWANAERSHWTFPENPWEYAAWGSAAAGRYGSRGTFWTDRPDLPRLPATHFEVWNEQNASMFLRDQATAPEKYAALYSATRQAIKGVDPTALVTVGGLVTIGADSFVRRFVSALPGGSASVDEIGYHPYGPDGTNALEAVREFRDTLNWMGLRNVPIALTESGFFPGSAEPAKSFQQLLAGVQDPKLQVTAILAYSENEWVIPGLDLRSPITASTLLTRTAKRATGRAAAMLRLGSSVRAAGSSKKPRRASRKSARAAKRFAKAQRR
jgi:hypothetical protein